MATGGRQVSLSHISGRSGDSIKAGKSPRRRELYPLPGPLPARARPIKAKLSSVIITLCLHFFARGSCRGDGPLSPSAELKTFRLDANFRMELVAAEPEVADPVAINWDASGR